MRLTSNGIEAMATGILGAVEWEEMTAAMPDGKPYGYLILEDAAGREIYNLTMDHSTIGRSHECDIVLPNRYARVSKLHIEIVRDLSGITVTDLGSRNGTFVNNHLMKNPTRLEHGNILSLGGSSLEQKAGVLTLELHGAISDETTVTEQGTQELG